MITDKTDGVDGATVTTSEEQLKTPPVIKCAVCGCILFADSTVLGKLIYYKSPTKQFGPFCGKCAARYSHYTCRALNESTTKSQKRAARRAAYLAAEQEELALIMKPSGPNEDLDDSGNYYDADGCDGTDDFDDSDDSDD